MGIIGPGKKIDTYPLPMDQYEKVEFAETLAWQFGSRSESAICWLKELSRSQEKLGRLSDLNDIFTPPGMGIHGSHLPAPASSGRTATRGFA